MKKLMLPLFTLVMGLLFAACTPSADQMKKLMEDNPDILYGAIKKDPKKFLDVLDEAVKNARQQAQVDAAKAEQDKRQEEFKNPKKPAIHDKIAVMGKKDAPIVLVEYSDFECPFCAKGYQTVMKVKEEYGDKVFVYLQTPAFRLSPQKLAQRRNTMKPLLFKVVKKLISFMTKFLKTKMDFVLTGVKFMDKLAKDLGVNMAKLKKDLKSDAVKKRVDEDIAEARKFGFSGTPGFLINGVSLKGAYPFEEFKKIIDQHLKTGG